MCTGIGTLENGQRLRLSTRVERMWGACSHWAGLEGQVLARPGTCLAPQQCLEKRTIATEPSRLLWKSCGNERCDWTPLDPERFVGNESGIIWIGGGGEWGAVMPHRSWRRSKSLPDKKKETSKVGHSLGGRWIWDGKAPQVLGFPECLCPRLSEEDTEHSDSRIPSPFYSLPNTVLNTEKRCLNAHEPRFSEEETEAHRG